MDLLLKIVNTVDYTTPQLVWFGVGCYLWAIVYVVVIRDIMKKKEVDIPWLAICFNFVWETYWGLGLLHRDVPGNPATKTDMGSLFVWAYAIWFLLDIYIVYSMFRYGWKQHTSESGKKSHVWQAAITLVFLYVAMFFFIPQFDDQIGAYTGWIVNNVMSLAFVLQKFKQPSFCTSRWVAILKFLGTGSCNFIVWLRTDLSSNETLVALTVLFMILDLIFIYLVFTGPKSTEPKAQAA
ncbi:MAG: hypothetical protein R3B47_09140 [Bacteroidia bacterium]